jgi:hypothetical protein
MKLFATLMLLSTSVFAQPVAIFGSISKTVTTAATPERLSATSVLVKQVCLQCSFANSGNTCYFGASSAGALAATGVALVKPTSAIPDALVCFGDLGNNSGPKLDLKNIWVNVATNSDEVNAFYIE